MGENKILDLNNLPDNGKPVIFNDMIEEPQPPQEETKEEVVNDNIIEGEMSFKVDMSQLKCMLITCGLRIEGLSELEIVTMGLNRLVPFGFNFE